jgi:hypothetical protein
MDSVSGVAMAKVILDQPEIVTPIRESEATGVSQHGVDPTVVSPAAIWCQYLRNLLELDSG